MNILAMFSKSEHAELLTLGRERGWVTYDEILKEFPDPEAQVEELDKFYLTLGQAEIEVVDTSAPQSDRDAAFNLLYGYYRSLVYSKALDMLRDWALAEDVVQDVFFSVWRSGRILGSLEGKKAWLRVITRNRVIDIIRARSTRVNEVPLEYSRRAYEVEETLTTRIVVREMIETLSQPQQEAIELIYYTGLPVVEAAHQLNESQNTIFSRKRLALKKLRGNGELIAFVS